MAFMSYVKFWKHNVAVDVGTATTRVAIGEHRLLETASCVSSRHALRSGVVIDGATAAAILRPLLSQARMFGIVKPCVLACAPSDVNPDELKLLEESLTRAGASSVVIIPEPLAAMVGAGVEVSSPYAQMVIDIGEGVTDCAVTKFSRVQETCSIRIGCAGMRQAIRQDALRFRNVVVSDDEAETDLRAYGILPEGPDLRSANGRKSVVASLEPVLEKMMGKISSFLRDLPHTLGCEIIESGIWVTGGGALVPGVTEFIEKRTGINVRTPKNPRSAVVEGARAILPVVSALNQWR